MIKIDSIETFVAPKNNHGALINNDHRGLEAYRKHRMEREKLFNATNRINTIEEEVRDLKNDISDLKALLIKALEQNK